MKAESITLPSLEENTTLQQLATELQVDASYLRKFVLKKGFKIFLARAVGTKSQPLTALTKEDAEEVKELWNKKILGSTLPTSTRIGYFYVMRITSEVPGRIKVGFSNNVDARLDTYQTFSPSAELIGYWPCRMSWERAATDSITRRDCTRLANEVFDCQDVEAVIENANQFFQLMPELGKENRND